MNRFIVFVSSVYLLIILSSCSEDNPLSSVPTPSSSSIATKPILVLSPTSVPSKTPTLLPTIAATSSPVPLDYSNLPPLSTLIVNGTQFQKHNMFIPDLLYQDPPRPVNETNTLAKCYVDCVKVAWGGTSGSLTVTMIRAADHGKALQILANEYDLFKKDYSERLLGFIDDYTGGSDYLWAAQASATPAYAEVHGTIFISLIWKITPTGKDVDTPWYLGQISCLAQYQFDRIDAQINPEVKVREPNDSCMITH